MTTSAQAGPGGAGGAVELLERALGYTGPALGGVREELLGAPTPCGRWTLRALLAHMDDALDAFTEAAAGQVRVGAGGCTPGPTAYDDRPAAGPAVDRLRAKACRLLGAWAAHQQPPDDERVGLHDRGLPTDLLVRVAALEIAVHGWDVARATGGPPLPAALAEALLPAARLLVPASGRAGRFAPPLDPGPSAGPVDDPAGALLRWLGRDPGAPLLQRSA